MPSQNELEQARQEDLKRILQAEAALLLLLRRGSKRALQRRVDAAVKADLLRQSIQDAVIDGRQIAAAAGRYRTLQQLRVVGVSQEVSERAVLRALRKRDEMAAARAGHGVANRWLTGQLVDPEAPRVVRPKPFSLDIETARIATYEAVDAFTEARNEYIHRLPDRVADQLIKVWQAMGDKRTCDVCDRLDGEEAPVREDFSRGDPPVHGGCRCSFVIRPASEAIAA